jgi:TPR repeat protein
MVGPNYAEAASWYRRAAEAGNVAAARALSSFYMTGAGVPRDQEEVARWLRVAAEAGDQNSQVDLAHQLLEGANLPGERPPVADWFRRTAAGGDLVAAFALFADRCRRALGSAQSAALVRKCGR